MLKVRYALAGQWRVGFVDPKVRQLPIGTMQALRGSLNVVNPKFPSLAAAYAEPLNTDWQFASKPKSLDGRLQFRRACATDADCGGSECGIGSCNEGGMCRTKAGPSMRPCGPGNTGQCCDGKCAKSCPGACK